MYIKYKMACIFRYMPLESYLFYLKDVNIKNQGIKIPWFFLVAGGGLEPPTFGLWAQRAANCSIPRCADYIIITPLVMICQVILTNINILYAKNLKICQIYRKNIYDMIK